MQNSYIYLGLAIIVIVLSFLILKPEFSMITGEDVVGARIMGIKENGDIILSDNTVSNINTYLEDKIDSLRAAVDRLTADVPVQVLRAQTRAVLAAKNASAVDAARLYQTKGNYLRNNDKVSFSHRMGNSGCGGDCRAITSFYDEHQIGSNGGWTEKPPKALQGHSTQGQIYLTKASDQRRCESFGAKGSANSGRCMEWSGDQSPYRNGV